MEIVKEKIAIAQLKEMSQKMFGNLVKAVVDVNRRKIAVDADLHSDQEALLLEDGSKQQDIWGINIYPELDLTDPGFIEFDSMINLRPSQGNRSRGVENPEMQEKIIRIVRDWIK
ncbi:MAG: hypothetical protein GF401_18335 [Chitinivibrionales bacterium]|nr:hypothetical protein [Chitinivibrionales bacterium]